MFATKEIAALAVRSQRSLDQFDLTLASAQEAMQRLDETVRGVNAIVADVRAITAALRSVVQIKEP
jgi:hypothetical protein